MAYNLIVTDEMDKLLENCVNYILRKFKNEQAASHLLDEVEKIYDEIEDNPGIYPVSDDPFLAALTYHEAVLHGMNYKIIYKYDDETVYILGIYHDLENYVDKIQQLWESLNGTIHKS